MSFVDYLSPAFLEAQYQLWKESPAKVPFEWRVFFEGYELGEWTPRAPLAEAPVSEAMAIKQAAVQSLLYRYRDMGHLQACTDPLSPCPGEHPQLALEAFGLSEADLDTVFYTTRFYKQSATLREILETLRDTYCRSIGVEYMHIPDPAERQWLKERMEPVRNRPALSREQKLAILKKLQEASLFELFLHRKFIGQKRFSLEGGEVIIPLLDHLAHQAAALGVRELVLGMAHRGRINVLANIFGKPLANIFAEFADTQKLAFVGEGDVKYHKGFSCDHRYPDGSHIHMSLASNPSHLEAVDPVVVGKCRARHSFFGPGGKQRVLPVLVHGDAAFAGQGIVPETLNLSQLDGYQTGGTLHIVLNNQIGFTTAPAHARSTRYATDVAKMLSVPIFHVHGEDPEAAVFVAGLALEYRQRFGRDAVVEIICFRRHGHNEGDEPAFTQPLMYDKISQRPPASQVYSERLIAEGLDKNLIARQAAEFSERLEEALQGDGGPQDTGYQGKWTHIQRDYQVLETATGVAAETLKELAAKITAIPEAFTPHPKLAKLYEKRRESVLEDSGIDWGTAESLAFASLLAEGTPVRLSGQDCRRGTFNQRHSTLVDIKTGQLHVPLAFLGPGQAPVQIYNSMLSEAAVLGFEYGYSLEVPDGLTIWEAQFGDFANGAQVIIDQFLASSHTKWDRASGLVMQLPHGFEGQGPEHSSARIERYLQLCAHENLQVAYPSTPAQLFHLLRRQVKQPFRRPLIIFTPKSLLRHPLCRSQLAEFTEGGFREIIPAPNNPKKVRSVLLCSGKIYFDLIEQLVQEEHKEVAVIRVEQLYPLRRDLLKQALEPFVGGKARVAWLQEEPSNSGAWWFIRHHLAEILGSEPLYVGRDEAASPAVGSHRIHTEEQKQLLAEALAL
ncbi:2-oxoglutarate dehydrogenase subunit E1 [Desulfuromonas versatilis]|uniref:oxoglutarate dehydrogenase (succinyl-transferring) n=1 Tax=Desulfuromonas versatilis TaxID=2802975 RepID=A0ABN6E2A3_9BACT|nr:2-oxoglutarate dehydrogenase E1 component [Desulfuromonas versatilis]BCR06455.1 2-oxoglutarate dehydrogenase subunit E1 [Desulfuromonas versatilis]